MTELKEIVEHYGSDKVLSGYVHTYSRVFESKRQTATAVLEIGIGTLDPAIPSSFVGNPAHYPHYKQGGSLRAWRDYFPNAQVYGIDIAEDCMFEEDRIKTFLFDSSDPIQCHYQLRGLNFDIIVDDGNHDPKYQAETLANLWDQLKEDGIYVIEDIGGYPGTEDFMVEYLEKFKSIIGDCAFENKGNHIVIYKEIRVAPELPTETPIEEPQITTESNSKQEYTLVTGLWNIGRSERDFESHYLPNFERFLKIDAPMVIFIPASLVDFVKARRNLSNTYIKVTELEDIKKLYAPFWENTQKIRTDENWLKLTGEGGWLPHSPQAQLEYYNPVVQSKMFMLHDASCWNPFDTDYFFWLDAGITNTVSEHNLVNDKVLDKLPTKSNPFLFLSYPYEHAGEIHGFEAEALNRFAGEPVKYVCRGGLFGGHKEQIREANATYYSILFDTLSKGYMGTEETIFSLMAYHEPYIYRRYALDGNGLIQKFIDHLALGTAELEEPPFSRLRNSQKISDNALVSFKTNLYMLTFNFPEQMLHTLKSMAETPEWLNKPHVVLLDNSTDEEALKVNKVIADEMGFEYVGLGGNTGICGGRQAAAEHFGASDADFMFFFEDDMTSNPPSEEGQFCRNGFRKYIPNLYNIAHKIMIREKFDFLKLSFTEVFLDNDKQTSWYNVPQHIRTQEWPNYDKLPIHGLDPNTPRTKFNNIGVQDGVAYIDGEVYYSNWPMIVSKEGNQRMFLDTTWAHPFEQTWMSHMFQLTREGKLRPAVLLASPIWHDRIRHYKAEERRES